MKPTLKEIEDNYERVLLRLHSGELAGIVDDDRTQLQVLRKTHWIDKALTTADLDKSYNRKNSITDFNIDAIAFLSNKSLVNDAIVFGCDEIVEWDWDINNPHNSKFKKGDEVRILDAENRECYKQILTKKGKMAQITKYKNFEDDIERIKYYVEIPEFRNEYQSGGLWVFHNENSIELTSNEVTYDDQMDAYKYAIQYMNLAKVPYNRDYIIKGDNNNMNNILNVYEDRKREKINKHYEQLMELTKLADERYAIFKDCSDKLDKLYKEDGVITHSLIEPRLAETTLKHLEQLAKFREEEYCKLENLMREVHAQLSMCETYEQKQNVLNTYKILKANGKINA